MDVVLSSPYIKDNSPKQSPSPSLLTTNLFCSTITLPFAMIKKYFPFHPCLKRQGLSLFVHFRNREMIDCLLSSDRSEKKDKFFIRSQIKVFSSVANSVDGFTNSICSYSSQILSVKDQEDSERDSEGAMELELPIFLKKFYTDILYSIFFMKSGSEKRISQRLLPTLNSVGKTMPKTFVFDSHDWFIHECLLEAGWSEIPRSCTNFRLSWTWQVPKDYSGLRPTQLVNHFRNSTDLTTKMGLTLLLKKAMLIDHNGKTFTHFYPRTYNLHTEKQDFVNDFHHTAILNLLKKIITCVEIYYPQQWKLLHKLHKTKQITNSTEYMQNLLAFQQVYTLVRDGRKAKQMGINPKVVIKLIHYMENMFSLDKFHPLDPKSILQLSGYSTQDLPFSGSAYLTLDTLLLLKYYHQRCIEEIVTYTQDGFSNLWMIKANYSSRGRNIHLIQSMEDVKVHDNGMKIVQKYIENIWVLQEVNEEALKLYPWVERLVGKKFDIRLWVLVKSFSPLSVYVYEEGYLRLSSAPYHLDPTSPLHTHLTNYSLNQSENPSDSFVLLSHFIHYLRHCGNNLSLLPRIYEILTYVMKSAQLQQSSEQIGCFQLFGVDVLLDAGLNPWVIECNMSPACAKRGELGKIAKQMGKGLLEVLGILEGEGKGWKTLIYQPSNSNPQSFHIPPESTPSHKSMKTMQCAFNYTKQISLLGEKLNTVKYLDQEKHQLKYQRIVQLQKFLKRRYHKKEPRQFCVSSYMRTIELLAKIVRKKRSFWIKKIKRKLKKYYK